MQSHQQLYTRKGYHKLLVDSSLPLPCCVNEFGFFLREKKSH